MGLRYHTLLRLHCRVLKELGTEGGHKMKDKTKTLPPILLAVRVLCDAIEGKRKRIKNLYFEIITAKRIKFFADLPHADGLASQKTIAILVYSVYLAYGKVVIHTNAGCSVTDI
jgi:hypothetical protein